MIFENSDLFEHFMFLLKSLVFDQNLYKNVGFETFRCEIRNLRENSVLVQVFLSKSDSFINIFLQNQPFFIIISTFFSQYQP